MGTHNVKESGALHTQPPLLIIFKYQHFSRKIQYGIHNNYINHFYKRRLQIITHGSRNLDKFELTLLLRIFNHIKYIVVTYLSLITYGILSYFTINGIL